MLWWNYARIHHVSPVDPKQGHPAAPRHPRVKVLDQDLPRLLEGRVIYARLPRPGERLEGLVNCVKTAVLERNRLIEVPGAQIEDREQEEHGEHADDDAARGEVRELLPDLGLLHVHVLLLHVHLVCLLPLLVSLPLLVQLHDPDQPHQAHNPPGAGARPRGAPCACQRGGLGRSVTPTAAAVILLVVRRPPRDLVPDKRDVKEEGRRRDEIEVKIEPHEVPWLCQRGRNELGRKADKAKPSERHEVVIIFLPRAHEADVVSPQRPDGHDRHERGKDGPVHMLHHL
mmetsp:Transcript_67149/g.212595  ORF Transcript_67149/g.212595 Transcript_67149/m.212595 type:complete len:286 (+) Transcript_67149:1601-2458(+)